MKKILLSIAALFVAASGFAQTGDPDWTKTGLAMEYPDWTGFADARYVGAAFTVEGWEEEKTIRVTDSWGTSFTVTNDDEENIVAMNGTEYPASNPYAYFSTYFQMGSIYYAAFTPRYSSYALCSEDEGYLCISGYFYDEADSQTGNWGYVYIAWDDESKADVKQIEWTALAEPRYSTAAYQTYYTTDHLVAGSATPTVVAYTDDYYKVFAFAGVEGYDLEFAIDGEGKMMVQNCEDANSKGNLHRVATGLTEGYGRLGIYNNGSTYDSNELNLNKSHGYINFPYAVGYTIETQSKYPYINYGLSWYDSYYTATGNVSTDTYDDDGNAVAVDTILVAGTTTRTIRFFPSDSLYVVQEYLGAGSADLWFTVDDTKSITVQAIPFGNFYQAETNGVTYNYDYFYNGKEAGWINYATAYDAENSYNYSMLSGTIGDDYEEVSTDDGYLYFFCYEGWDSTNNGWFYYNLDWSSVDDAVKGVEAGSKTTDSRIYDLQGRQLQQIPAQGLYIRGGKKFIVK